MPRTAFGFAAVALMAMTMGLVIIAPAKTESAAHPGHALVAAVPATSEPVTATIVPARIEVIGVRDRKLVSAQPRVREQKGKQG
jgi:hypothetical protein